MTTVKPGFEYIAKIVSTQQLVLRLGSVAGPQAVWEARRGNPEGKAEGSRGHLRVDLQTGALYVKTTPSGTTGWVKIAFVGDIPTPPNVPQNPDASGQVDFLFTGVGGPNATVDTSVLRVIDTPVVTGSGISVLQNTQNGTVFGVTVPGVYTFTAEFCTDTGGGTVQNAVGLSKNTNAAGLVAVPAFGVEGMFAVHPDFQTLGAESTTVHVGGTVFVSAAEAAAINPDPLPNGALFRPHGRTLANTLAAGFNPDTWRMRLVQSYRFTT